jgi:hypothetical protein
MMAGKNDDAASTREDQFLAGLIPQAAERLAEQHAGDYDIEAVLARFSTWLAAHTGRRVREIPEHADIDRSLAAARPVRRRHRAERRPTRLRPVRRRAALARAAEPVQCGSPPLPGRRPAATAEARALVSSLPGRPLPTEQARGKEDETGSRIRLGPIDIRNGHLMSFKQVCTFMVLILIMTSAFTAALVISFDGVLHMLTAHSSQLARLNPDLVSTTITGVFSFMGVSVATKAVLRWAQSRRSSREEQTADTEAEEADLRERKRRQPPRRGRPCHQL